MFIKRFSVFLYGAAAYALFLATFVYAIGFIGNFGIQASLDGVPKTPLSTALLTNVGLLSLFAIQHSVMARPAFKRWLTRFIPASAERSTYVLASSLALVLLFLKWEPLGGTIWDVESQMGRFLLYGAFGFGWTLVLVSTFVINHFDLFGLRQVWRGLRGQPQANLKFVTPALYRMVRHPLYVGWLFVFWSTPTMTMSHLLFAVMTTLYILVAVRFEEADLVREHPQYSVYRRQVPMLIPRLTRPAASGEAHGHAGSATQVRSLAILAASVIALASSSNLNAHPGLLTVPPVPSAIRVPDGNVLFLKGAAVGTQNYVCVPGTDGPTWKFLGPQATLFVTIPWFNGPGTWQIATHYLSSNAAEGGTPRPTWQHSYDSSVVWGKPAASSTDPAYVATDAIPWLLVQAAGSAAGPMRGAALSAATFIQRVNTAGGVAPTTGCDASNYGATALVPYTTDYYFYKADERR